MAFTHLHELIALAEKQHMSIGQVMLKIEQEQTGRSEEEILAQMEAQFKVIFHPMKLFV